MVVCVVGCGGRGFLLGCGGCSRWCWGEGSVVGGGNSWGLVFLVGLVGVGDVVLFLGGGRRCGGSGGGWMGGGWVSEIARPC